MSFEIFKSRFFMGTVAVALVLLVIFLGKELKKRYEIRKEIQNLQQEIASLETKNQETSQLINYFKTREFQERQARSLLNLQKPGEFVVALPFQEEEDNVGTELNKPLKSNLQKWWEYFFNASR